MLAYRAVYTFRLAPESLPQYTSILIRLLHCKNDKIELLELKVLSDLLSLPLSTFRNSREIDFPNKTFENRKQLKIINTQMI